MATRNGNGKTAKALKFEKVGRGLEIAHDEANQTIHIQCSYADAADAPLSSSGKMHLVGNSRGWFVIENSDGKSVCKGNVTIGVPVRWLD